MKGVWWVGRRSKCRCVKRWKKKVYGFLNTALKKMDSVILMTPFFNALIDRKFPTGIFPTGYASGVSEVLLTFHRLIFPAENLKGQKKQ